MVGPGIPVDGGSGGRAEDAGFDVRDCAGEVVARVDECSPGDVDSLVRAVTAAAARWRSRPAHSRVRAMLDWAAALDGERGRLAELLAAEAGALRSEAELEVDRAVDWIRYYSGLVGKVDGRVFGGIPGQFGYTAREPYDVVAGVNAAVGALALFAGQASLSLASGSGYLFKAHAEAPLAPLMMAELAQAAGVEPVAAVAGSTQVGEYVSTHTGVGLLAFTGRSPVGREVIAGSVKEVTPLVMGLGARNAALVLDDAALSTVVPAVLHSRFSRAGQEWFGVAHVYVHESLFEDFVARAVALADRIKVGPASDPDSLMGPLLSRQRRQLLETALAAGVADGARVLAGGRPPADLPDGAYFAPTVVVDASPTNPLRRDEVVGPVLTVSSFGDVDQVVAQANASQSGAVMQVWGRDVRTLKSVSDRLEAGAIWINTADGLSPEVPIGSWKSSGYGTTGGVSSLDYFTRTKAIMWDLTPLSDRAPSLAKLAHATKVGGAANA
ncbi:hypothetical protein BCD48_35750 [Pseudofrankia sp. BMG5.36]|nr:hypothetical protein BCD48_35750 [Pseudofrankia sp. BMG5.36]